MKKIFIILGVFLLAASLFAATPATERLSSYEQHLQLKNSSIFQQLNWRNIGPYFMGGRITDIEVYENRPHKFLVAAASGGVWLTENNATTFKPVFDHESTATIGDIAISQADENLIWVGSGENNSSRSTYAGTGVFKSTDGGKTWRNMGLTESHHIGRIVIHPENNAIVYVAALGHLYTDNPERGVYKTTDGGQTWARVLFSDDRTGAIDLVMHPKNPDILFAATWEKERKAWNMTESGDKSGIYRTTDGGKTWQKLAGGFPQGKDVGRIGLCISRSNPDVVYAFLDNQEPKPEEKKAEKKNQSGITVDMLMKMSSADFLKLDDQKVALLLRDYKVPESFTAVMVKDMVKAGRLTPPIMAQMISNANQRLFNTNVKGAEVYRSDDGGEHWYRTHKDFIDLVYTYGYYFGQIRVSPENADIIYILGVPTLKSLDGGKTFKDISEQGGIYGDDGVHADMHAFWIDPRDPKRVFLGTDGGLNISYDAGETWQKIANFCIAQCYTIHYDNRQPYNVYTGLQDNGVNRGPSTFWYNDKQHPWNMIIGGDGAFVQPDPNNPDVVYAAYQFGSIFRLDVASDDSKSIQPKPVDKQSPYRFNWLSPFMISHHNPYTLYMGANKLLKSVDRGDHWLEISPDLTERQHTDGDVPFATITAIDESPLSPDMLYAGTDDGNVWIKKEGSCQWEKISAGLPKKWLTRVVASQYKKERVYVTLTGYREDDFATYVYVSEDYGKTWQSLKGNLPQEPVNVIREDPVNENFLYLGTDLTVYVTLDRGIKWHSLRGDLPTVAVYDLRIQPREKELIIGTHGRGVYILPVKTIEKLDAQIMAKPLHLFNIAPVKLDEVWDLGKKAKIEFFAGKAGQAQIVIQDKKGQKMAEFSRPAGLGLNVFEWDLVIDAQKRKTIERGEYTLILKLGTGQVSTAFTVI